MQIFAEKTAEDEEEGNGRKQNPDRELQGENVSPPCCMELFCFARFAMRPVSSTFWPHAYPTFPIVYRLLFLEGRSCIVLRLCYSETSLHHVCGHLSSFTAEVTNPGTATSPSDLLSITHWILHPRFGIFGIQVSFTLNVFSLLVYCLFWLFSSSSLSSAFWKFLFNPIIDF